jgi:hypothetical protein
MLDVTYNQLTKETQKQVDCLADNIYHEAGFEPNDGKVAVALVTLNRMQDPRFPKDICGVVKQRTASVCQFSWFCHKVSIKNKDAYAIAKIIDEFKNQGYNSLDVLLHFIQYIKNKELEKEDLRIELINILSNYSYIMSKSSANYLILTSAFLSCI